jgi:hypothetical protein
MVHYYYSFIVKLAKQFTNLMCIKIGIVDKTGGPGENTPRKKWLAETHAKADP